MRKHDCALRALAPRAWNHAQTPGATAMAGGGVLTLDLVPAAQPSQRAGGGGYSDGSETGGARAPIVPALHLRGDLERCARFTSVGAVIIAELAAMAGGAGCR